MRVPNWVICILQYVVKELMIGFFNELLDNPEVTETISSGSYDLGKWITDSGREAMGDRWEELETKLQDLYGTHQVQLWNGLDYDDKEK